MNNELLPDDDLPVNPKPSAIRPWVWILIPVVLIGLAVILVSVFRFSFNFQVGGYSVEEVVMSKQFVNGQPDGIQNVFRPDDNIICTVKTSGIDSIIGMKWYYGDQLIYEATGRTRDNVIRSYIQSNSSAVLPEGQYHVDVYVGTKLVETVEFEVKLYHPEVDPPISIPTGHIDIETPTWFTEVPFAFDEVWSIDGKDWTINQVKVMLAYNTDEYWVAVIVNSDVDITGLSESEVKEIARPIALYAIENGYVETARAIEIDGQHYALDQYLFVTLINLQEGNKYAVQFTMDELE